ncbi:hypothetical protein SteCoe_36908 [Stentor coeruleus]|uniref:BTB domain-containing protein n=1 Tax=Stentor coeruleus TaxID=5963 RepID=A0A1R2AP59_9CILI|nr:hypothetical protein SteCoe_36908 [Stentor coeruleus]
MEVFCNNPFLSDCQIIIESAQFPAHKIVLAAYSEYFNNLFKANNENTLTLPELIHPKFSSKEPKDIFPHVLKYLYNNQNQDSIAEFLDSSMIFMFLSLSQSLLIKNLKELSEKYIIYDILSPTSAIDVLNEGLHFNNNLLVNESIKIIVKHFEDISQSDDLKNKLNLLPYNIIKDILSSSDLKISQETIAYNFLCAYLTSKETQGEDQKITEEQKLDLLKIIRWSHLSHSELLKAASNPLISSSKDLILEGLSAQLSQHEEGNFTYRIPIEPRESYSKMKTVDKGERKKVISPRYNTQNLIKSPGKTISQIFSNTNFDDQMPKTEFVYEHDYDKNGILYYLATRGYEYKYQNPHDIGEVRAFASGIGYGKIEEFVGRSSNSLRTKNEEGAFLGVDLGPGRKFLISAYSIRNSINLSHISMNWQLEGSEDRKQWRVLDRRIHYQGNSEYDMKFDTERNLLMKRGTISTWAVSDTKHAFRFFRISLVGFNASGTYSLALSCIELYGTVVAGRWP